MIGRTTPLLLSALIAFGALTGCGSKSKSSSSSGAAGSSSAAVKHYRPGQFCSSKKTAIYAAQGLACSHGHLKKK